MKLGTLLLRNAAIGLSQLEAALRNQVLYGGRLGTNLVELGYIDLEMLSAYLAELSGFPIATPTLLEQADPALLERLGAEDAHRLRAIPLGYLGEGTGTIAVALVEPMDFEAVDQVAARLEANVTPYIVPELRALYYLERLFGLPRRARFVRSGRSGRSGDGQDVEIGDRRRTQPPMGMVMPPSFTLEPRRRRPTSEAPPAGAMPFAIGYGAACERIDTATNRDQIAEAFVQYAQGRCDALVVFLIRDGNALGWRSWVAPPAVLTQPIEELSLPLGGASSLQSAHDAGQPFVGTPPSAARPVEKQLWAALATQPEPFAVLVVPVLVKQRAVNLIYAHIANNPPPPSLVTELGDLALRAQTSYLRLIRQARGS
jgi:Type II secretion system (T2SS), protein E, N-terminal domain